MGKKIDDGLTAKQRYFKKVYDNAPIVECVCGCGTLIKSKDKYARDVKYVNGHNNRRYEDPTQYKREWNHRNREQRQAYKTKRAYEIRVSLLEKLGNKCSDCGLEHNGQNTPIFDFHHIEQSTKEFNINMNNINNYSKDKVLKESEKCRILCSNCHRLHHWYENKTFMDDVDIEKEE
ncbi:hypothetical protein QRE66_14310 [Bacillus cereus]|nr:hypothetical protein QRE66_14310 [Bacillus cereus]